MKRAERVPGALQVKMATVVGVRSRGEKIEVDICEQGASDSLVRVVSKPNLVTTLFDWGKNERNVTTILEFLIHEHGGYASDAEVRTAAQ